MGEVRIREGVMVSHFDMLSDLQWAIRRGGVGKVTLQHYMERWGYMLYPATPHLAEEWNQQIGRKSMLAETIINNSYTFTSPTEVENDVKILAAEKVLRNLIDNARNVKGLAERHSESPVTKLVIQTSPEWKNKLMIEAIKLHAQDFDFMKQGQSFIQSYPLFQEETMRGELMQFWRGVTIGNKKSRGRVFSLSEGERMLVTSGFDESAYILEAADFIAETIGVNEVVAFAAGDGEDIAGKARFAGPLQPGLAFL